MTLKGYFKHTLLMFHCIQLGSSLRYKVRIFFYAVLKCIPRGLTRNAIVQTMIHRATQQLTGITVKYNGLKYRIQDEDALYLFTPEYEPWIHSILKPSRGQIFLDIGSDTGLYAIQMARLVGAEGKVIALEPHPSSFRNLNENIQLNHLTNITPLNLAAWNKATRLKLYTSNWRGQHTTKRNLHRGYIEVEANRLDTILKQLKLQPPHWIKIDVEGSECEVLKGLVKTLKASHPHIVIEIQDENRAKVCDFVSHLGYRVTPIPLAEGNYYLSSY